MEDLLKTQLIFTVNRRMGKAPACPSNKDNMKLQNEIKDETCPLCFSESKELYSKDKNRIYVLCPVCNLVFVPDRFFMTAEAEKKRYDCHNNTHDDEGYVNFLYRLITPLKENRDNTHNGLDFGSGPIPVFADLMKQDGYDIETYDIFYDNRPELLKQKYDFITVCEVIEHLHNLFTDLTTLFSALNNNGLLAIMTQPAVPADRFFGWRYKNDPTHVLFFSDETFEWIAEQFNCTLIKPGYGVYLLERSKIEACDSVCMR